MKALDRYLQRARIRQALRFVPTSARLIDVGAHEGELFRAMGNRLHTGFGVEPLAASNRAGANYVIRPGYFPDVMPPNAPAWDAITLLAVLEHVPRDVQPRLAQACAELLRPGGRVVITVPSPWVDHILRLLRAFRLIDGMSLEEHYGFEPADVERIFAPPLFRLAHHRRFQLGLNHVFVFERTSFGGA